MKVNIFQLPQVSGRLAAHVFVLLVFMFSATFSQAKPTPLSYHSDLNYLVKALETYHPNPWQSRKRQAFRQDLTANPNILNSFPIGPILNISRALNKLDKKQQDGVTGLNLFQQNVSWKLLPVEFLIIENKLYLHADNAEFSAVNNKQVLQIGGIKPQTIIKKLQRYFSSRDKVWLAGYMRITDILNYFGADCRQRCELMLASSEQSKLVFEKASFQSVTEAKPTATYLIDNFWAKYPMDDRVMRDNRESLRWILYGKGLSSSILFDKLAINLQGMMRDRSVQNLIVDLRGIQKTNPILERRFIDIIKEYLSFSLHRKVYILVDHSTGTSLNVITNTLDNMSEVIFVGDSRDLALAAYHDPQNIELPNSKISVSIARRYERLQGANNPEQVFIPDERIIWKAKDFFSGKDSLLEASMILIELNESN